jgi:hypothetical protein
MFQKQVSRPLFWGLVALGALACVPAMAQENNSPKLLRQPSAFEAINQVAKTNSFWSESLIGDDASTFFVIDRDEARIQRRSERFERVYLELMKQQSESGAIIRTVDISNTYTTSLLEAQP